MENCTIIEWPDQGITMEDGCRLSARIWMPDDAQSRPVPAILEYLPYRKRDGTVARDCLTHPWFAAQGYACVRVDMRGNGDSHGLMDDEYTQCELDDGVAIIAWLAKQDWCDGNVGMMGISWGGFNSLQIAALRPPALKAIITLCSTVDRYNEDIHFKGGCLLNENLGWGATMLSYSSRPPDPALVGDGWRDMWLQRLDHQPFLAAKWLTHPMRDDYWQHGSVCEDYGAIQTPTLSIGGWGDAYKNAVPDLVNNLQVPAKGIVGPWVHKYPHFAVPEPRIGFLQEARKWWDRWLKSIQNGAEDWPAYRAFVLESEPPQDFYTHRKGGWVQDMNSPMDHVSWQTRHLGKNGVLSHKVEDIDIRIRSAQHCGAQSGEYCAIWLGPELPGDQRDDDALSQCFDGDELKAPLDIYGRPQVHLRVSVDQPVAQICVRLCDVGMDGASTRITYGVLNLCQHNDQAKPEYLVPGKIYDINFALDNIAYRVMPDQRLRVAVSTSYWPLIWPSPNLVTMNLHSGNIALPIRQQGAGATPQFAAPDAALPWEVDDIRPATNSRKSYIDPESNMQCLDIIDDFGEKRDRDHGLQTGSIARENWRIHPDDPLQARGDTHWTQTLARADWMVSTQTFASMRCCEKNFYLTGKIKAYSGDDLIFTRDFDEVCARQFM